MARNNLKLNMGYLVSRKRRGVAEVISSLLLVVITVVGAIILTNFLDESFVSGSQAVASSTDSAIKSIKLRAYDTRDGSDLFGYNLHNEHITNPELCRESCNPANGGSINNIPTNNGSEFLVFQIENRGVNPIFLKNIFLDNVNHHFDSATAGVDFLAVAPLAGGVYPSDGTFSILSDDGTLPQLDNQIVGGATVNVIIKLHSDLNTPDIELGKTMRVELNIGKNSLAEFLIETGDTL